MVGSGAARTEDLSRLDLAMYLKVARWYCFLNVPEAELDFAGSQWLDDEGLVLPRTAGWTFGYYYRPSMWDPQRRDYAVVHVNQAHAVTRGGPGDVSHRGIFPLYVGGLISPRQAIAEAHKQNLPRGDRYGVEYESPGETTPPMSVVTSYLRGLPQGSIQLFARQ